jgi:hypothetical protein
MALTTAERQKRFRAERDGFYKHVTHGPKSSAKAIVRVLEMDRARQLCTHLATLLDRMEKRQYAPLDTDGIPIVGWCTPIAHDAKGQAGRDMCLVTQAMMVRPRNAEERRLVAAISPANKRRVARKMSARKRAVE